MINNKVLIQMIASLTFLVSLAVLYNYSNMKSLVPASYRQYKNVRKFERQIINASNKDNQGEIDNSKEWKPPANISEGKSEKKVRVLCWIMTQPGHKARNKCKAIRHTWGKRCDILLFISSKPDYNFPIIGLNVSEGRDHLTAKTMSAFDYIHKHHFDDADWFMKADDDTYVIVENLKYFLSQKNSADLVYYGQVYTAYVKPHGYNSGGAGYVISKEALKRFGQRKQSQCLSDGGVEDIDFGSCLKKLEVFAGDSFDKTGRSRFHGLNIDSLFFGAPAWYYQYDLYNGKRGISRYPISFHYMLPHDMYMMDFTLHHIKAYGFVFPPYRENDNGEEESPYSDRGT